MEIQKVQVEKSWKLCGHTDGVWERRGRHTGLAMEPYSEECADQPRGT